KPKMCPGCGFPRLFDRSAERGSTEVNRVGKQTTTNTSSNKMAENQKIQLLRSDFQACFHWLSGGCEVSTSTAAGSSVSMDGATKRSCPGCGVWLCISNPRI